MMEEDEKDPRNRWMFILKWEKMAEFEHLWGTVQADGKVVKVEGTSED